jgi:predicted phosphodiesterase
MRYGIFSDVHGNLEALEVTCDFYKKEKIDRFIFLGDIVGYATDHRECICLLQSLNPVCIAGNHDWAAIDKLNPEYFNPYAKEAILWTKKELSMEENRYLNSFELIYKEKNFICVHGSLQNPQEFNYILGINDAHANFPLLERGLLFIGHSHRMEVYLYHNEEVVYLADENIKLKSKGKYIVNVGSVGQPRDRDSRLALCIYDSDDDMVLFKRLEYNIQKTANKILKAGLPAILAQRLYVGW